MSKISVPDDNQSQKIKKVFPISKIADIIKQDFINQNLCTFLTYSRYIQRATLPMCKIKYMPGGKKWK